jgi:transcriptional regulator with XRE-family HTH domain
MDITTRIARRVRELRDAEGFTLDALAERSGVSRSNISLIERGQSSPTAAVLDKLAASPAAEPSPVARVAEQPVWTDPASGYVRRNLSPAARSPIQLVDVVFPAGQRVAYESAARETHQQVWMTAPPRRHREDAGPPKGPPARHRAAIDGRHRRGGARGGQDRAGARYGDGRRCRAALCTRRVAARGRDPEVRACCRARASTDTGWPDSPGAGRLPEQFAHLRAGVTRRMFCENAAFMA